MMTEREALILIITLAAVYVPLVACVVIFVIRFRKNYVAVGEKDGIRYYQHKTKHKRTFITLSPTPDRAWLKFEKDVL